MNNFKKRFLPFMMAMLMLTVALTSCAKSGLAYDAYDYDLNEYITTRDIGGIEVSRETVENEITERFYALLWENSQYTDVSENSKVEANDIVLVDYTCAVDGLTIDAFGKKDASFRIGSKVMIPGMEDGLIGMTVKDQPRVLTLTFPEEYYSDLGGKQAVFTVTLKKICRTAELTDELIKKYTNHDSIQAMRDALTKIIAAQKAFDVIYESVEVKKYPEKEYNEYYSDVTYLETYAKENKTTVVEFLAKYGDQFSEFGFFKGMTEEEYKTACKTYAETMTKEQMLVYHLLRQLKVKTTGKNYEEMKDKVLRDSNMSDIANYDDVYGEGSFDTNIRFNLMLEALYEHVELK